MDEISKRYPGLVVDNLRTACAVLVTERNAVASDNKERTHCGLGLALLQCDAVRSRFEILSRTGTFPWLRYVRGPGLAYVVVLNGVPMRVQPDIEEIRVATDVELAIVAEMRTQLQMFNKTYQGDVLRLEVLQPRGEPVARVILYLFNEDSGDTIDQFTVYERSPAKDETSASSTILMGRRPQDVQERPRFTFDDAKDEGADGSDNE